jgi:3-oxoacyl-[acyl-carrier-protein] synthase-3
MTAVEKLLDFSTDVVCVPGGSSVMGVGAYLPPETIRIQDLLEEIKTEQRFGIPSNWLTESTGIVESRVADPGQKPSDLALAAAEEALEYSGVDPSQIGAVVYCGMDRDYVEPATSHVIQSKLGIPGGICFDLSSACHGFVNGMQVINQLIACHAIPFGLIVSGEIPSRVARGVTENLKRGGKDLFMRQVGALTTGDAGAAMILGPGRGIKEFKLMSRGEHYTLCHYNHAPDGTIDGQLIMHKICHEGLKMHRELWRQKFWQPGAVDKVIAHQVGKAFHDRLAKILGIARHKMSCTFPYLGNLTSTTIPVNLARIPRQNRAKKILVAGSGSGISISHIAMEY